MVCSYTLNPTGEKHTISAFVHQTRIQLARQRRKNKIFHYEHLDTILETKQRRQNISKDIYMYTDWTG